MGYTLIRGQDESGEWYCYVEEIPTMKAYGKTEAEAMANIAVYLITRRKDNENLA